MERIQMNELTYQEIIDRVVTVLQAGGLVVYPTETTYGVGADATNPAAVAKLLSYKSKRQGKALSIMVSDEAMAEKYVDLNTTARQTYSRFLPGPVTVVSVGRHVLAPEVESADGSLGVRISSYTLVRDIARAFGKPFTATGANPSGEKRPYTVDDVLERCTEKQKSLLDLVIDAGTLPPNEPSTVVDTTLDTYHVLRQGTVRFQDAVSVTTHSESETQALGFELAQRYRNWYGHKAVIFALEGEMGAGKTQFVKGLASGLGITGMVKSPSYVLVHEYEFPHEGRQVLFAHIDAWRLEKSGEIEQLGIQAYLEKNGVIALEWANIETQTLAQWQKTAAIIWVRFAYGEREEDRAITFTDEPRFQ